MQEVWGATPEVWRHFASELGWRRYLLPVCSNPNRRPGPDSKLDQVQLGKIPSIVYGEDGVAGFGKWTSYTASEANIAKWSAQPDHGICVQTGKSIGICAIDIDVPDVGKARAIREMVEELTGVAVWPERYRDGTGKTLLVFGWMWGDLFKHALRVDGGLVEILAQGQQFIAAGSYLKGGHGALGERYKWRVGDEDRLPVDADIPWLDEDQFDALLEGLELMAGVGSWHRARSRRGPLQGVDLPNPGDDPVAAWLHENWTIHDFDQEGRLYLLCPFDHEHSEPSPGAGDTSTWFAPGGTGGYERGHWRCLHAHCEHREDVDFNEACGYAAAQFPVVQGEAPVPQPISGALSSIGVELEQALFGKGKPRFITNDKAEKLPVSYNVYKALWPIESTNLTGIRLAFDVFRDSIMWCPLEERVPQWQHFGDEHYSRLRASLAVGSFKSEPSGELVREGVYAVAKANTIDTAQEWLSRLKWDGVKRVETMLSRTLPGIGDDVYTRALSRYLWTGLAGRVLEPGVKADMALVLVGDEGVRKSSWVAALSPSPDFVAELNLKHRDDDTSRKLRGCLVAELAELQGLAGREGEDIRAFISRQYERWTPKFKEFTTTFPRRCLLIGTSNDEEFLEARMGMRRLLPLKVDAVDLPLLEAERDQLWAEAAVMFAEGGVDWSVETVAQEEREKFIAHDDWMAPVARWLLRQDAVSGEVPAGDGRRFGTEEALHGIGVPLAQHNRGNQTRAGRVLSALGCEAKKLRGGPRKYVVPAKALQKIRVWAETSEGSAL